ncbi:MAG: hypothetical protein K8T25_16835 [Planctomycetia bacterium]|nr:hypothetical protein [Planctomycetia bacterium]
MAIRILLLALGLWASALITSAAVADDCCECGCKVCKLVKTEKKVTVTCYGAKCKDICIPGKGCKGELVTECVDCGKDTCTNEPGRARITYSTDEPACGKVRTVKELVKYEVTKKVPSFKWEVVNAGCSAAAPTAKGATAASELPTPRRIASTAGLPMEGANR